MSAVASDWWYARAYPGSGELMDAAAAAVAPWLRSQATRLGASAWHFVRYLDMTGQHLRVRVRCTPDQADELHHDSGRLLEIMGALAAGPPRRDLVASPFTGLRGSVKVRHDLYAPETAKYGGPTGVALAEEVFTSSSELFASHGVGELPVSFERAALAVRYLGDVVARALEPTERHAFWRAHQQQWAWHARMAVRDPAGLSDRVRQVAQGISAASPPPTALLDAVTAHGCRLVEALDRAGSHEVAVDRTTLLRHLVHMDLNRWGLHPAEELVLGVIASLRKDLP